MAAQFTDRGERRGWLPRAAQALAAALFFAWPAAALAAATGWVGDGHAAARLITAADATGSAATVDAGLEIRLAPGWHAYWRSPGDAGIPPSIDWAGSQNLAHAEIAWPAPQRYSLQGFETAGYRDHVVLPIALSPARPGEALALHANVDWAACAQICVPYTAKFDLALPAGRATPSAEAGLIGAARARVPRSPAAAAIELRSAAVERGARHPSLVVRLVSTGAAFRAPDMFVEGLAKGSPGRPAVELTEAGRNARLTVPVRDADAADVVGRRLTLTVTDGARAAEFAAAPEPAVPLPGGTGRLLPILAIALLGGLVLNAMPCVLPVLSLKLLSVASHAGSERRRLRLGLLITGLGVIASFALIAAMLIALEASGAAIGWGIQFQWPWFIAAMAAVTALFAASLWGWLPIGLPRFAYDAANIRTENRYGEAFLTGVFATLLATPCSAPFVGTAVGFALAQGPADIAAVFLALGIGMAAPYLAAAALPQLVRLLPRPGRWMGGLRVVLGLALAGTAGWLLSVLAALSGPRAAGGAAVALAAALALLALKSLGRLSVRRTAVTASAVLVAAAVLGPALAGIAALPKAAEPGRWRPFDAGAIPRLVAAHKTVFVDVTAAWCLTCKVNEAAVLDREPVAGLLSGPDVVAMRGDWTRPDPLLTRYLESFGRYGIPFNAVYGPGRPSGELLPELLSAGAVEKALDRAAAGG